MAKGIVVLVEDSPSDALLAERSFSRVAPEVELRIVTDGESALDIVRRWRAEESDTPALVVLDLNVPRVSGFEILATLKSERPLSRLPVVVLSSSERTEDVSRAYDLGANAYFVKPLRFDVFMHMVAVIVEHWLVQVVPPPVGS